MPPPLQQDPTVVLMHHEYYWKKDQTDRVYILHRTKIERRRTVRQVWISVETWSFAHRARVGRPGHQVHNRVGFVPGVVPCKPCKWYPVCPKRPEENKEEDLVLFVFPKTRNVLYRQRWKMLKRKNL